MVLTEILDLLELTRKLVSRKAELDKEFFTQFVEPAWMLFVNIHQNYNLSFQDYIEFTQSDKYKVSALLEKIRQDSFQTNDARAELTAVIKNLPTAKLSTKEVYLANFAKAIANYFYIPMGFKLSKNKDSLEYKDKDAKLFNIQEGETDKSNSIEDIEHSIDQFINIRVPIFIELSRKDSPDGEQAKTVLENAFQKVQLRYHVVVQTYYKLRTELLS
jgi:hypothetical protein